MIKNYLTSAFRNLWKTKTSSLINIVGLTAGMTTAVFIMLWVQNELTYDAYHSDAGRIYRVTMHNGEAASGSFEYSPLLLADEAKIEIPVIEKTARLFTSAYYSPGFTIKGERIKEKKYAYVDEGWFRMFHYKVVEGSIESFGQDPFCVVLTESSAKKYFGNYHIAGQHMHIDSFNYKVKAVIQDNPSNSSFQFDIWLPISSYLADPVNRRNDESWSIDNYLTFFQLQSGADRLNVSKQLNTILNRNIPGNKAVISLRSLKDIHFENTSSSLLDHGNRNTVIIFSIMAVMILLIACVNYITLTTARAGLRIKEVSIRKIVGASRYNLAILFLIDSLFISLITLFFTLILTQLLLPGFNSVTGRIFELSLYNSNMWKVLGGVLFITLLFSGVYPAILLSGFNPLGIFRGEGMLHSTKRYFQKSLIVAQFAFSIVLVIGAIVIFKQLDFIQRTDKRYDRSQVFSVAFPRQYLWLNYTDDARINLITSFKQRLITEAGIQAISIGPPITDVKAYAASNIDWVGRDKDNASVTIASLNVDDNFKEIFNLQLAEGRWFSPDYTREKHAFLINETALREFKLFKPVLGQRFVFAGDTGQIIGVVKDFHFSSFRNKIAPLIFYNKPEMGFSLLIKTMPGAQSKALQAASAEWKNLLPGQAFDYSFMDEAFDSLYRTDQKTSKMVLFFAIITIIISALGLFGLVAFTSEQRKKEIGIRKVLGATTGKIIFILSKDIFKLVAVAIFLACPVAWLVMDNWLQNFAYRIDVSWKILTSAALITFLITLITISFQAIKAAIANPVRSLRTE